MIRKIGANTKLVALSLISVAIVSACVTVNVNFPEGAVQRAATDYVNELYKAKQEEEKGKKDSSSFVAPAPRSLALQLFIPQAHALEFQMNSAKVKEIQQKQKDRIAQLIDYKKAGAIGESDQGLIEIKDIDKIASKVDQLKAKKLITSENSDRDDLYKEIISLNGLTGEMEGQIRKNLFENFKNADPAGVFYKENGQWKSK